MAETAVPISEQAAQAIAEMESTARERAASAKEGDVLAEAPLADEGGMIRRRKQRTMVRSGDVELPKRVPYYRTKTGNVHMLPTAQLVHFLSKKNWDGTPVFVKERPAIADRPAYHETCEVCLGRRGIRKKFPDEFMYVTHMEILHASAWRVIQKRIEKDEGAKNLSGENIALALMSMSETQRQAIRALLGTEESNGTGTTGEESTGAGQAHCEACGWTGGTVKNVGASLATHRNIHCPERPAAGGDADGGNSAT